MKSGSLGITIVSGLISLGAVMSLYRADDAYKPLLVNVLIASSSIAATNQLMSKYYGTLHDDDVDTTIGVAKESVVKLEKMLGVANQTIHELRTVNSVNSVTLETSKQELNNYVKTIKNYDVLIRDLKIKLDREVELRKTAFEREDTRYASLCSEIKRVFHNEANIRIAEVCNRLTHAAESNLSKLCMPNSSKQLQKFITKTEECFDKCQNLLSDSLDTDIENLPSYFLSTYNEIHQELILLEVKWRGLLNIDERLAMYELHNQVQQYKKQQGDLVPIDKAREAVRKTHDDGVQQLEGLVSGVRSHGQDIEELKHQVQDLLNEIEKRNLTISELKKPMRWSLAARDDLKIGNIVIGYFEGMGIILDRAKHDNDGWQSTLSFHIDRNTRIITPGELNPHSEKLQQLCHTLSPVKFDWNSDEGLMAVWLHLSKKPIKAIAEQDVNKIWKTADKFQSVVKQWARIRLTGGSESGKSPTAENIAVCILLARGGDASLYNPQDDSVKNYWTIPTVGSSHEDSLMGIGLLAAMVNEKTNDRSKFKLWIFDEIDSTIASVEKKNQSEVGKQISTIVKQFSHQNLGVVFLGQNSNAKNYPGMDRSDWNSAVNLHIGANAYDAITNSNQITNEEQTRLKLQADKLTEYCSTKNNELGLEKTNPQAYRFAVVLGDGKPYFIQLPDFGQFTYDMVKSAVKCPKCESHNHISNGKNRRKCKDCGHVFDAI